MRTLGQALNENFQPGDSWPRHALAGLGTQVSLDMPIQDLAAGRTWLTSQIPPDEVATLLVLTVDRLVFGQTTTGNGGLRWVPLESVENVDAIEAADGSVLNYELQLTGGIGLSLVCPESFVTTLIKVLLGDFSGPEPSDLTTGPQLSDVLTPVADDASELDRMGPAGLTERTVPVPPSVDPIAPVFEAPPVAEPVFEAPPVTEPVFEAPPVAEPVFEAAPIEDVWPTPDTYGFEPADDDIHGFSSPPVMDPQVHAGLDSPTGQHFAPPAGFDSPAPAALPETAPGPIGNPAAPAADPVMNGHHGLPQRTPGATFSDPSFNEPLVGPRAPEPSARFDVIETVNEYGQTGNTQEVPVVHAGEPEWPPADSPYLDQPPTAPVDDRTRILDAQAWAPPAATPDADYFAPESFAPGSFEPEPFGTDSFGTESFGTEPGGSATFGGDAMPLDSNGVLSPEAPASFEEHQSDWRQWPEGTPKVATPAGYSSDEISPVVDDFSDLAVDIHNPGDLANLDEPVPAPPSVMYAAQPEWWANFREWPEPFRSVTYLGGHPKHSKRRKNVTLHFTPGGLAALGGGLGNWEMEIPWSEIRSIDVEGSDELMFRSSMRIDLSSSALVVETEAGMVFFECRLRRPASVRTALAAMSNSMGNS